MYFGALFVLLILALGARSLASQSAGEPIELRYSGGIWCPLHCESKDRPGYGIELLRLIFPPEEFKLESMRTVHRRGSRGLGQGRNDLHLFVALDTIEDSGIVVAPVPQFRMRWAITKRKNAPRDFRNHRISFPGVSKDKSHHFVGLDTSKHPLARRINIPGDNAADSGIRLLMRGRADSFIDSYPATKESVRKLAAEELIEYQILPKYVEAYFGISEYSPHRTKIIQQICVRQAALAANGDLQALMIRYGLQPANIIGEEEVRRRCETP